MIKTHKQILEMWPNSTVASSDIGESSSKIRIWKSRNSIPAKHWKRLVAAAADRDYPLTYKMLAEAVAT